MKCLRLLFGLFLLFSCASDDETSRGIEEDISLPHSPMNLEYDLNYPDITISWEDSLGANTTAIGYKLYLGFWSVFTEIAPKGGGFNLYLDYTKPPYGETNNNSFTFKIPAPFQKYRIGVVAVDRAGNMSKPTEIDFVALPSETTYEGDIKLSTQAYVDFFEGHNIETLNGNLYIQGIARNPSQYALHNDRSCIDDLSPLKGIKKINGDLIIGYPEVDLDNYNLNFTDLTFLNDLVKVSGDFFIAHNDVKTIPDFNKLEVGGSIKIIDTDIDNIKGFNGLSRINGDLMVSVNNSLEGFNNIKEVQGKLLLLSNKKANYTNGFSELEVVSGDLNLKNIDGINKLSHVKGDFIMEGENRLEEIKGFNSLIDVEGDFIIENSLFLKTIAGFNSLKSVWGHFYIEENPLLETFSFNNLSSIAKGVSITGNDNLLTLNSLEKLETIGEELYISYNTKLENIDALSSLVNINSLLVYGNNSLKNLNVFGSINNSELKNIDIVGNENLISFEGFPFLKKINYITIHKNKKLLSFEGLSNIEVIEDYISIKDNNSILNLEPLKNLKTIKCSLKQRFSLVISDNFNLYDFCDLKVFFESNGLCTERYLIEKNAHNPTHRDIVNGNCSN